MKQLVQVLPQEGMVQTGGPCRPLSPAPAAGGSFVSTHFGGVYLCSAKCVTNLY